MLRSLIRRTFGAALILVLISAFTFFMFFRDPAGPGHAGLWQELHSGRSIFIDKPQPPAG
ncbi:hypothetical protein STENM327S_06111 [Streptomyces tendae]